MLNSKGVDRIHQLSVVFSVSNRQDSDSDSDAGSYLLHNIVLVSKLFVIEAELLNKIGRHLLHLIIRKGLAKPRTSDNDIVLALHTARH